MLHITYRAETSFHCRILIIWRQWISSSLVQMIAWPQCGTKPIPELMLTYCQILIKIEEFLFKNIHFKMPSANCRPYRSGLNVFYDTGCWHLLLTHWDRVTHICVDKLTIIGSDNGLSPGRHQAFIWTNAGILLIGPRVTNFSEILIGIQTFLFMKMHLKMSSAKWRPFCFDLNVLKTNAIFVYNTDNIVSYDRSFFRKVN